MKNKIESDVYLSTAIDVFLHRGDGQKPHRKKASRQKAPGQNPRTKTPRTKTNPPCKDICMYACTTKNWGFREV